MAKDYNPSNWRLAKRLLGYIKPYTGTYVMINVTAFGREGIYSLIAPLLVLLIIDYALLPVPGASNWFLTLIESWTGVSGRLGLLIILSSLMIVLAVIRSVFFVVHRYLRGVMSQRILRDMRGQLYNALINKSFSYLGQVRTGQIISHVTSDMNAIDMFYSETVRETFRMSLQLAFTTAVLLTINLRLTAITLLPLPIVFLTTRLYMSRARERMIATRAQFDSLNSVLIEGIAAQKLIKGFGQETAFAERFEKENQGYVARSLRTLRIQAAYTPSNTMITAVGTALVLSFGGIMVSGGSLTLGELIVFGTYFNQLVGPVRMYARLIDFYQDGLVSARRIFEVLDVGSDVPEAEHPVDLPRLRGDIEFRNASFSYGGTAETLKDVNLKLSAGEKVAIIGFVGSGKTALTELVPRFYDVTNGQVLLDGHDVREASLKSLRSQIGIVLQDIYIFSTTIRENISFGRPDASDDEVTQAARASQIHDYISSLPKGYDTEVGERGLTLSGGQRQRIAIARVLLTDPRILILDDSTSNVDAETEVLIRKAIDALLEERTALIITQRASTCENADKVVVVDEGRVIA
ncbi:ABC transporter ATP-binding protein/permease, partial [Candidatus Bathyarchaeota archaeon]|nr:ABC transporter ATP-binding protein/permease [Candidatus Bathyarchaeota archaeon]